MKENNKYTVCKDCDQQMAPKNGCLFSRIQINGKTYTRVKHGDAGDFGEGITDKDFVCHDCNAGIGQYHHMGCDAERCPKCHMQLLGCDCLDTDEVYLLRPDVPKASKSNDDKL